MSCLRLIDQPSCDAHGHHSEEAILAWLNLEYLMYLDMPVSEPFDFKLVAWLGI